MSKTITIIRVAAIFALGTAAMFGIFSVPHEDLPPLTWTLALLLSKVAGGLAAYAAYKLYSSWRDDILFMKLEKWCGNDD